MKNIGYLECQRGGYHSGEFLNIVCFEPGCKDNLLCCCACIQEMHQNHKTKTLKKLILDADGFIKNAKPLKNQPNKQKVNLNTDIMANMVQNEEKDIINKLKELKNKILQQIENLQDGIHTYYKSLHQQINKPQQKIDKDPKLQLAQVVQSVQGSGDIEKLRTNVLRLIKSLSKCEQSSGVSDSSFQAPTEQSYLNFLKNSNNDISNIVNIRIQSLSTKFQKQAQQMKTIISKVGSFWSNSLFTFSKDMHHDSIDMINPFTVIANVDSVYQMALMNPGLNFKKDVETFTFRINTNDLQWVAVGVCYKNIGSKNNFNFRYDQVGHGCYLVSGNAGTWSHSQPEFNNAVKAFNFKEGDSITCTVSPNKICFFKNVKPELEESLLFQQKEYYELEIKPQPNDVLHPCVVCYYMNTEVEYLPSFKNLQLQMPNYPYKFTKNSSHDCTIIVNDIHLLGCHPISYKCSILDNPIEKNPGGQKKSVTFRIVRSTSGWIGIGLCHKKIVNSMNYDFVFDHIGHGCYMISANGGSWSHSDPEQNNIVKTFKFIEGDLITVSLDENNNAINFKKGIDNYKLPYKPIEGDQLYPVVVLYYPEDQVQVLPDV